MKKLVDNNLVDMTKEEIAEHKEAQASATTHANLLDEKITEKDNIKASAKAKLMSGEALTEDEANTIVL